MKNKGNEKELFPHTNWLAGRQFILIYHTVTNIVENFLFLLTFQFKYRVVFILCYLLTFF